MFLTERALAHGGIEHAQAAVELTSATSHVGHALFFGTAVVVYLVLGFRLYYLEFKRTGRWQPPK